MKMVNYHSCPFAVLFKFSALFALCFLLDLLKHVLHYIFLLKFFHEIFLKYRVGLKLFRVVSTCF